MIQVINRAGEMFDIKPEHLEKFLNRGFTRVETQPEVLAEVIELAEHQETEIGE
jgi:hypothetical protein